MFHIWQFNLVGTTKMSLKELKFSFVFSYSASESFYYSYLFRNGFSLCIFETSQ